MLARIWRKIYNRACDLRNRKIRIMMVRGYRNPDGTLRKNTRISNTVFIDHPEGLSLGDHVFIGHYNFIEASQGVFIGEGCQVTNFISLTTHSSHNSIRVYGRRYIETKEHKGYVRGKIRIGKYSFIGPHSLIMPNTNIGKGSIVAAYSNVAGDFPDFSIIRGNPAKVIGDTRSIDENLLRDYPDLQGSYDAWSIDDS
ncbi:MAG: acyltransferase [Bacteroidales bacterium]